MTVSDVEVGLYVNHEHHSYLISHYVKYYN